MSLCLINQSDETFLYTNWFSLKDESAADSSYTNSITKELKVLIADMDFDSEKDERILRVLAEKKKDS